MPVCTIRNPFRTRNAQQQQQRGRYFTRQRNSKAKFLPYSSSSSRDIYPAHRSNPAFSPCTPLPIILPVRFALSIVFSAFKCFTVSFHSTLFLSLFCSVLLCCVVLSALFAPLECVLIAFVLHAHPCNTHTHTHTHSLNWQWKFKAFFHHPFSQLGSSFYPSPVSLRLLHSTTRFVRPFAKFIIFHLPDFSASVALFPPVFPAAFC